MIIIVHIKWMNKNFGRYLLFLSLLGTIQHLNLKLFKPISTNIGWVIILKNFKTNKKSLNYDPI